MFSWNNMLTVCWLGGMGTNLVFPSISLALTAAFDKVDQHAWPYLGYDPMFIGYPLRELLDIVLNPVMLGVEDVHAILGCSYSVFI